MTNNPVADLVARAITEYWGERCSVYKPDCPRCKTWAQYDALTSTSAERVSIPDDNPDLNLAAWMDIRRNQIGPWADYLIREVGKLEQEVSRLRVLATLAALTPASAEPVAWRNQIANLSVWSGKAHEGQQLVDLAHVLAIIDEHPPAPMTAEDGRPCSMDEFSQKLFEDCDDIWDRSEAIQEWLLGDWDAALEYLEPETARALSGEKS